MITRGAFNHLLRPGLRRDFRDSYQQHVEEYSQFLKVGTQDRAEVEAVALSGLPRMILRGEVEPVVFIDPAMSPKVTYVDDEYALGFEVSKRMMEDDLYRRANQNAKGLGRSSRLTQEYRAAELLDDAFTGNTFTGLLGEALISTSHTFVGTTGTWSNRLAADTQFGVTGLQAAFDLGEQTKDHTGDPIPLQLNRIILNIADEWAAIKILQSDKEPFTADNQVNAIIRRRKNLDYVVSHYKIQGSDWFVQDSTLIDSHFLFRIRPQFWDDVDPKTLAALFMARQRVNIYFFDPRGWIGSNPP
jgi:hypothetical protein